MIEPFGIKRNKFVFFSFSHLPLLILCGSSERNSLEISIFLLLFWQFPIMVVFHFNIAPAEWNLSAISEDNFQGKHKNNEETKIHHFTFN
jgi:hypothetical protein